MEHRKLSEEEASQLFEATFLLISQQNLAQKQRTLKNRTSPQSHPAQFSPPSPLKLHIPPKEPCTPQSHTLLFPTNPQNSPGMTRADMNKKWSMEKSSSNSEGMTLEKPSRLEQQWKDENSDHSSPPSISRLISHTISQQVQPATLQKHSQMQEQSHEELFVESMIKQLKRDLEIRSRGKICKSQEVNSQTGQVTGYHFYCKNDPKCPFSCSLEYTGNRNPKNQKLYKLIYQYDTHIKGCIESEEQVAYMRLTKSIDQLEPAIIDLLSKNAELKPKEILSEMAKQQGEESPHFIYRGLTSKNYHKATKKYFDNMIYKIKSQMGIL